MKRMLRLCSGFLQSRKKHLCVLKTVFEILAFYFHLAMNPTSVNGKYINITVLKFFIERNAGYRFNSQKLACIQI